ncbi:MAG: 30S ribosomal protein S8 [Candidatus Campbellbacteria bacterium]|nr:30S ribosomal protein S8 [Candidatus Campbellbacteria bacterium]
MVTDPIGDFLTRIENAGNARQNTTTVPFSSLKENIAKVLEREGYIASVETSGKNTSKTLEVGIKYSADKTPRVNKTERVSKPSRRMYTSYEDIKPFKFGKGNTILSTPKGILTDMEAKKQEVGGEILFSIW